MCCVVWDSECVSVNQASLLIHVRISKVNYIEAFAGNEGVEKAEFA